MTRRTGRPSRLACEGGANAVEFALVLPILVLLLFGAITFGIAFNRKMQMSHAAREAVRFAATDPNPASTPWYEAIFERVVATAAGELPVNDTTTRICVSVETDSGTNSLTANGDGTYTSSDDLVANGTAGSSMCYSDGLSGTRVQVTVARGATLDAVFFRRSITLSSEGVAYYEQSG